MGFLYADVDRKGRHKVAIQLGRHGQPDATVPGGMLTFQDRLEPEIKRQHTVFIEMVPGAGTGTREDQVAFYHQTNQDVQHSINALLSSSTANPSDLNRMVTQEKPELVFPDAHVTNAMVDRFIEQGGTRRQQVEWAQGGVGFLGAGTALWFWTKKRRQDKAASGTKSRKKRAAETMTRRQFFKRSGVALAATAAGIAAVKELDYVSPIWSWWMRRPGLISGIRDWARRLGGRNHESMDFIKLRNVVMAEKIARFMRHQFKDEPAEAGLLIGVAHAGIKEYLEDSELRRKTIEAYPGLDELIDREFTENVQRHHYDPKKGRYELEDLNLGFQ
ncbi:hypothetical protein HY572_00195 [Candidatus Micrarchaeota archaeon]|nr:hypothetical protein [Candidatus Micrarchaeota archaeon]